jgi:hypothetical protein
MDLTSIIPNYALASENLGLGSSLGLWDILRNKITIQTTLLIYLKQAKDKDLEKFLHKVINKINRQQISTMQKLLTEKGYNPPNQSNWGEKQDSKHRFAISKSILNDKEIVLSLGEIYRLTLSFEVEALRNATDLDARNILYDVFQEDNEEYMIVLKIQKEKEWTDFPLYLFPQ